MLTLLIAIGSFVGYLVAYHTYGRWLARRVFNLDPDAEVPSQQLRDNIDYVPTRKEVIFGHHFTSIAGTGPIVGPAIAVFWGWLPALLWVLFGSIFIGAVHDFGALVISLRNRGQTVGEVAGRLISPRARVLFLLVLLLALTVVLAVFGLVIASIFAIYPESVLPTWASLPLAVAIGMWVYRRGGGLLLPSLLALGIIYGCVWLGAYYLPIDLQQLFGIATTGPFPNAVVLWTFVLLAYCFVASVLPVWVLLQPRDYINSHQLVVALVLLAAGLIIAGATGRANLEESTPAVATTIPADAPPILPFLFITIACGACSGFHCLVSSGTTSKQIACETDAQYVAYGSMLLEGGLAVMVILACCAGVGMGQFDRGAFSPGQGYAYTQAINAETGEPIAGLAAWSARYNPASATGWRDFKLRQMVGAFVDGGANFLSTIGIPIKLGIGLIAVLVACFAATTLDSATRLNRYVVQELATTLRFTPLNNKYAATAVAVILAGALAMMPANPTLGPGSGGLILWPLFGATNQLLAGLALMVTVFYLWRRSKPILFALIPMLIMLAMPAAAMLYQMFAPGNGWLARGDYLLLSFGIAICGLQVWMVIEGLILWPKVRGVVEDGLPPLPQVATATGGPNC
ncbi:MAG: carbon starvation protein A [Maioricimonas sp. JB049]